MGDTENGLGGNTAPMGPRDEDSGSLDIKRLGTFVITAKISSGGMGTVYKAFDESLKRVVALKVLHPALESAGDTSHRFAREAWIAGQLEHPNIIKVFSQGQELGLRFMVLEYADGGSLADLIRQRREAVSSGIVTDRAFRIEFLPSLISKFVALARALHYVHENGFIHRDIKPHNILLSGPEKTPKLTDFGIAHADDASKLTRAGDFMGTIKYMSPELLTAHRAEIDRRSDVYSLGVTLYELTTLTLPFEGETEESYISQVVSGHAIPARRRNRQIPQDLETVISKSMSRDPLQRYDSAAEFADDLQRILESKPVRARRQGLVQKAILQAWRRHKFASIASLFVLTVTAFLAIRYSNQTSLLSRYEEVINEFEGRASLVPAAQDQESLQSLGLLRDAFLSSRLSDAQMSRVATLLLAPQINASDLVSRTGPSTISVNLRRICDWDVVAVVQPTIRVSDSISISTGPLAPLEPVDIIDTKILRRCLIGKTPINLTLSVWLFRESAVDSVFGSSTTEWLLRHRLDTTRVAQGSLTSPITSGNGVFVYGRDLEDWEKFWPSLEGSGLAVWHGTLQSSKNVQVIDELPSDFPLAVSTIGLDVNMRNSLRISDFQYQLEDSSVLLYYYLWLREPLPVPLAGYIEIMDQGGRNLHREDIAFAQGSTTNYSSFAELEDLESACSAGDETMVDLMRRLKEGDSILVKMRYVPSRAIAARIPGLNTFWNDTLEFTESATQRVNRRGD